MSLLKPPELAGLEQLPFAIPGYFVPFPGEDSILMLSFRTEDLKALKIAGARGIQCTVCSTHELYIPAVWDVSPGNLEYVGIYQNIVPVFLTVDANGVLDLIAHLDEIVAGGGGMVWNGTEYLFSVPVYVSEPGLRDELLNLPPERVWYKCEPIFAKGELLK